MSDFSSITVSNEFPLPDLRGHNAGYFQTRDLPEDPGQVAYIGGVIESDGLFVRTDTGIRQWNAELSGWAYFTSVGVKADFAARFDKGRVAEVKDSREVFESDIGYVLPSADGSPNNWIAMP
jgi:hypothetical protein